MTNSRIRKGTLRTMRRFKIARNSSGLRKSCQTLYQSSMKMAWAGGLILIALAASSGAKSRHCMLRVHVEANQNDGATFSTSVRAQFSGKEVAIEKAARITESDVRAFTPYEVGKNNYGALLQLDDHGTIVLDSLSIEQRGRLLFVFINGRSLTELQIDKRVSDGQIYIASGLNKRDIDSMKQDWALIGKKKKR